MGSLKYRTHISNRLFQQVRGAGLGSKIQKYWIEFISETKIENKPKKSMLVFLLNELLDDPVKAVQGSAMNPREISHGLVA